MRHANYQIVVARDVSIHIMETLQDFQDLCASLFSKTNLSKFKVYHVAIGLVPGTLTPFKPSKSDRYWYESSDRKSFASPVSTHAEMAMLYQLNWYFAHRCTGNQTLKSQKDRRSGSKQAKLDKIDVLVLRFNSSGQLGDSRPASCAHND